MTIEATYRVRVVAGCVIVREGKVVLVQEKQPSVHGLWNLPAGGVDIGESFEQAAVREAKEECGLDVRISKKIGVFQEAPDKAVKHTFLATAQAIDLVFPPDELIDARWFSIDEIQGMEQQLRAPFILESINLVRQEIV